MRKNSSFSLIAGALFGASLLLAGCPAHTPDVKNPPPVGGDGPTAVTTLEARSSSAISGQASFTQVGDKVRVVVEVSGATAGQHGLHIHETGDCSAPDAKSAGGHFNPHKMDHGSPDKSPRHAGDFGNITVGDDGKGKLELTVEQLTVLPGDSSVVGKALVLHEKPDDVTTQPSGNSGARIGCGVINLKQ